jgi:hypothetical protein
MLAPRSLKREMGEVVPLDLLSVAFDPVLSLKDRHNSSDRESWVYQPRVYRSLEVFVADRLGDRGPCTSEPNYLAILIDFVSRMASACHYALTALNPAIPM